MNNQMTTTTPAGPPDTIPEDSGISAAEAKAVKDIGLGKGRVKIIAAKAITGAMLDRLGLFKIGASNLAICEEGVESSLKECDDIIAQSDDHELKAKVLEIKQKLLEQHLKLTELYLKAQRPQSTVQESTPALKIGAGSKVLVSIGAAKAVESGGDGQ